MQLSVGSELELHLGLPPVHVDAITSAVWLSREVPTGASQPSMRQKCLHMQGGGELPVSVVRAFTASLDPTPPPRRVHLLYQIDHRNGVSMGWADFRGR